MSDSPTNLFEVKVPDFYPAGDGRTDRTGKFVVRKRTTRVQMQIECEYARQTEGLALVTDFLSKFASAMSDLKVMIASSPNMRPLGQDGEVIAWDPEELDAAEEEQVELLFRVWEEIRKAEVTFRKGLASAGQAGR